MSIDMHEYYLDCRYIIYTVMISERHYRANVNKGLRKTSFKMTANKYGRQKISII